MVLRHGEKGTLILNVTLNLNCLGYSKNLFNNTKIINIIVNYIILLIFINVMANIFLSCL